MLRVRHYGEQKFVVPELKTSRIEACTLGRASQRQPILPGIILRLQQVWEEEGEERAPLLTDRQ